MIYLDIPRVGGTEITAIIKEQNLYLPVVELFDFLKIKNTPDPDLQSVSGFFINTSATYLISRQDNQISYQKETFKLEPGDLIRTESGLFLKSTYFGKVFGLECVFSFRNLSVTINTKLELPMIREMRMEEMRNNLTRLKGEVEADTNIGQTRPLFQLGVADWAVIATEEIKGTTDATVNLGLGAMILGGEATANLYYNNLTPFSEKQQHYLWRYVNNDFKPLRQVMAGKIATDAISTIYSPVVGIAATNTPTTYRRSFGTYTLSDVTEPGWIVELYVNNILVDYVKADASGFFKFEVPLVYGNSLIHLKFFGPWGEERTRQQNISIPFNFLPKGVFEYKVGAGIVEDTLLSKFSRVSFNYGVSRRLTLEAGYEYLSSVTSGSSIPYAGASMSVLSNLLISAEYAYGVRSKGTLSYRLPSNIQFDIEYTKYDKDQTAINYNFLEERRAAVSMPLSFGKFNTFQRLSAYQIVLPGSNYTTGEWLFSGSFLGVNTNVTTNAIFIGEASPTFYTNLSLQVMLPANFILRPQVQYGFNGEGFQTARIGLEKFMLKHGFLNLSYEHSWVTSVNLAEIGFRYDFSFAQLGAAIRQNNKTTSLVQYARGSLIHDNKTNYLGTDNRSNVGRGGISVIAFLDLNSNGLRDPGEPKAQGLNLRVNGGRVEKSEKDTITRILGLEPYTDCFIELDENSFPDISWRLPFQTLSVTVDPNILKTVEIPIDIVGEATGSVTFEKGGERGGIGRIILSFFTGNGKPVGKTLSEDDGYYSYFGLAPGKYFVMVDTAQMRKLGMLAEPDSIGFSIVPGIDGDIAYNLNFTLAPKAGDSALIEPQVPQISVTRKDTTYMIVHEVVQELVTISRDSWAIQLGAFKVRANAENLRRSLEKQLGRKVEIIVEGDYYKVRITDIADRPEVDRIIEILRKNGITELWVISLRAKQQQWVLTEKTDSVVSVTETAVKQPEIVINKESSIQVGAFRNEAYASVLRTRLSTMLDKQVVVVQEDGYYKVRISGFDGRAEMEKYLPRLGMLGLRDLWLMPVKKEPEVPVVATDTVPVSVPVVAKVDTIQKVDVIIPVIADEPPKPTVALQVAVFYRKSQALRAQKKIISKLDLPVEVVQQWDTYRVIVTGFFTREETYKWYPELAGLGYDRISLIEEK